MSTEHLYEIQGYNRICESVAWLLSYEHLQVIFSIPKARSENMHATNTLDQHLMCVCAIMHGLVVYKIFCNLINTIHSVFTKAQQLQAFLETGAPLQMKMTGQSSNQSLDTSTSLYQLLLATNSNHLHHTDKEHKQGEGQLRTCCLECLEGVFQINFVDQSIHTLRGV